ncbi:MAG: hypothetical protein IJC59_07830, partial [Lachnospiraceae bacterium]|nr:hypothetical protein [Lachnospiraceae bacterium]
MQKTRLLSLILAFSLTISNFTGAIPVHAQELGTVSGQDPVLSAGEELPAVEEEPPAEEEKLPEETLPEEDGSALEEEGTDPADTFAGESVSGNDMPLREEDTGDTVEEKEEADDAGASDIALGEIATLTLTGLYQEGSFAPPVTRQEPQISLFAARTLSVEQYLYQQLVAKTGTIDLSAYGIAESDISAVLSGVINDNADLYFVESGFNYSTASDGTVAALIPGYKAGFDDTAFQREVENALGVIRDGMSDLDKAIALHDYLVLNCEYDPNTYTTGPAANSYTAYGILVDKVAVCQGYALAYMYLCRQIGIECYMVTSDSMNHAWNLICLNGNYYQVDVTWDDPVADRFGLVGHEYMFLSDTAFLAGPDGNAGTDDDHEDWVITSGSSVLSLTATDTAYDAAYWLNTTSPLVWDDGSYYYTTYDSAVAEGKLRCYDVGAGTHSDLVNLGKWYEGGSTTRYYGGAYSGLFLRGGRLYYNTYHAIKSIATDGTGERTEYSPDTASAYIYGLFGREGSDTASYRMTANPNEEGAVYSFTITDPVTSKTIYAENLYDGAVGAGTYDNPYRLLENALAAASHGDTIVVKGGGTDIPVSSDNELLPFVIDKKITITSESGSPCLSVRRAGLLLKADVTFRNLTISLTNPQYAAIFANGHDLTLENISRESGSREIHLFAGGLNIIDATGQTAAPHEDNGGRDGRIIINGSKAQFGNIYAGSMNGTFGGDSSIVINGTSNMEIGSIYASGALQGWYDPSDFLSGTEPEAPVPNPTAYPVTGEVSFTLNKSNVKNVDGKANDSGNLAGVIFNSEYQNSTLQLSNISALSVESGHLKPAALNDDVNISIAEGAVLNLSAAADPTLTAGDFTGGGVLMLGQEDTLFVNGTISGETVFIADSTGSNTYTGTSGIVIQGHGYIDVTDAAGTGIFTFTPYSSQEELDLLLENGKWTAMNGAETAMSAKLESFALTGVGTQKLMKDTVQQADITGEGKDYGIHGDCVFTEDSYAEDLGLVPFEVFVKAGEDTYWLDSVKEEGYYVYTLPELYLKVVPNGSSFYVSADGGDVAPGEYTFTFVTTLASGDTAEAEFVLTVEEGEKEEYVYAPYWDNGNFSHLILFVDYRDTTHAHTETLLGECREKNVETAFRYFNGGEEYPRSLRQYMYNVSYGQLRVENIFPQYDGEKITPYTLSRTGAEYKNDEAALIRETIAMLNASGQLTDAMQMDLERDGYLDNLTIVVPSDNGNATDLFVPHKSSYTYGDSLVNGAKVFNYNIQTEGDTWFGVMETGVLLHEFFHSLGYPDLYRKESGNPVYKWDIMSTNAAYVQYPLAYMRSHYSGWFDIPEVTSSQTGITLYAPTTATQENKDRQAVILKTDYSSSEFFVVEYRKKGTYASTTEYEVAIPGSGLIVYRVVPEVGSNYMGPPDMVYVYRPNDYYTPAGYEAAQGDYIDFVLSGEEGRDSYGSSDFGHSLAEGAITYSDGTNSGIVISNIGQAGGDTVTFDVTFHEAEEGTYWTTYAQEEGTVATTAAASCMMDDGTFFYLLTKGNTTELYRCTDTGFVRVGAGPGSGSSYQLAEYNGTLYAGYLTGNYDFVLAKYSGSAWTTLFTSPSALRPVNEFSLSSDASGVYFAYPSSGGEALYAMKSTGAAPVALGRDAQVSVSSKYISGSSIAAEDGRIVVGYREAFNNNRLYVKEYDSASDSWRDVGSQDLAAQSLQVAINNGRLYVVKNGGTYDDSSAWLYSCNLEETDRIWRQVGTGAYAASGTTETKIAFAGEEPYLLYMSNTEPYQTTVMHLAEDVWTPLGSRVAGGYVSGLGLYIRGNHTYVTYLPATGGKVIIKYHNSESTGQENLPVAPMQMTVETKNPYHTLSEDRTDWISADLLAFGWNPENLYGSQIQDAFTAQLYDSMVESYVTKGTSGNQTVTLDIPLTFTGRVNSRGELLREENCKAAQEKLESSFRTAFAALYMDYPELFWMEKMSLTCSMSYRAQQGSQTVSVAEVTFRPEAYYAGAAGLKADYERAKGNVKAALEAELGDRSNRFQKVDAIYGWLRETLTYDTQAAASPEAAEYGYAHTSAVALLGYQGEKKAVSEGYAKAFAMLCHAFEIPCVTVLGSKTEDGTKLPYMWNYVQMEDGKWYAVDAASDDRDGAAGRYLLVGSNAGEVGDDSFGSTHAANAAWICGVEISYTYPTWEAEGYLPEYCGDIETDELGQQVLVLTDMGAPQPLTKESILDALQWRAAWAPYQEIVIVRTGNQAAPVDTTIYADIVNAAAPLLDAGGRLCLIFRDQTTGGEKLMRWNLIDPVAASTDKDGSVTAVAPTDGTGPWTLTLPDSSYPANLVQAIYSEAGIGLSYESLLMGDSSAKPTIYYYEDTPEGERILRGAGYYEKTEAHGSDFGELHSLYLSDVNSLGSITVKAEVSRYDWRLEYGYTENSGAETPGTIAYYTSEEEMTSAIAGMSLTEGTKMRVSHVGEEQPESISGALLQACTDAGLHLEFIRRDERSRTTHTWSFAELADTETAREDFSLKVTLTEEGADLPLEYAERDYIYVELADRIPSCKEATLTVSGKDAAPWMAGQTVLYQWERYGDVLKHASRMTSGSAFDADAGAWFTLRLNDGDAASGQPAGYVICAQFEYGWTSVDSRMMYIESRTNLPVKGWEIVEDRICYFDENGYLMEGPSQVDGKWYLFGDYAEGRQGILTGYVPYGGHMYCSDSAGVIKTGWQKQDNRWRYFSPQEATLGQELPSTQEDGSYWVLMGEDAGELAGRKYYFNKNTTLLKNWQTIEGKRYFFTAEGYVHTGWYPDRSVKNAYYFALTGEAQGQMLTGYQEIEGQHFFFHTNGIRQYGWQKAEDTWHYFCPDPRSEGYGAEIASQRRDAEDAWYTLDGNMYYFLNNARLATGWQTIGGSRYYFETKADSAGNGLGRMYTGTQKIGNAWYHFMEDENRQGVLGTGFFTDTVNGVQKNYYAAANGVLQRGWQKIDGLWRFFSHETGEEETGKIATDYWAEVTEADGDVKRYYFISGTRVATGWQSIEGSRYYFDANGVLQTGFFRVGNHVYYGRTEEDQDSGRGQIGQVVTGELTLSVNETETATYYFASNYTLQTGFVKIDGKWRYFDTAEFELPSSGEDVPDRGREHAVSAPVIEGNWYWYTVGGEKYCLLRDTTLLKNWQTIHGQRYYLDPVTGAATVDTTMKIGAYTYCFDGNGVMQKDTVVDGYGYNAAGQRVRGWQKIANEWHCFDSADAAEPDSWKEITSVRNGVTGGTWVTLTDSGETYFFRSNTSMVKGWQTIDGKKYYFDGKTGILQTGNEEGLFLIGKNTYYLGADGALRTGWIRETEGGIYYANASGVLLAGWQKISNLWYYFDRTTYRQDTGALVEDGYFATVTENGQKLTYYFVNGVTIAKGWQTIQGKKYYFDANGVLQTGFFRVGRASYYFDEDRTPKTGWWEHPDTRETYYFNKNGQAVTGWQTIDGSRYYFDGEGIMQTQRTKVGNVYYFFGPDGKMRTGFIRYCDTTYYFAANGQMRKGWQTIDGSRYYFDGEGVMLTGFVKIGNATYYFDTKLATRGRMAQGVQTIDGSVYYFNTAGVRLTGWQKINNEWRYFAADTGKELAVTTDDTYWVTVRVSDTETERAYINNGTTVLKGWQLLEGKRYYFDSNGFQWTEAKGWLTIGSNRFYFDDSKDDSVHQGFLRLEEGGVTNVYYLNANGQMLKGWQTVSQDGVAGRHYLDPATGILMTGHQRIGNYYYYLDPAAMGRMATGYREDLGYYYNAQGLRLTGWYKLTQGWKYFDPADGRECSVNVADSGWATVTLGDGSAQRAYIKGGTTVLKGWQNITENGVTRRYYFDANGLQWTEAKGWLTVGSNRFYFDDSKGNSVHQGFLELEENGVRNTYYLNGNGQMLKGWQTVTVNKTAGRYYLNPVNGVLMTGHQRIGNVWYYLNEDTADRGRMATGYISDALGENYYYHTNGTQLTGWRKLPGEENYRYFDPLGNTDGTKVGAERTLSDPVVTEVISGKTTYRYCWYTIEDEECQANETRYCFLNNTTLLKNRQSIDGRYYWFHSTTGALYTGYFAIGQNRYYANADGSVYQGFDPADPTSAEDVCYYNSFGQRVTGWQNIADADGTMHAYYFNANGVMLKGICWIGAARYIFHPENGRLVRDSVSINGNTYYANTNGTLKTGWNRFTENGSYVWRYLDAATGAYVQTQADDTMPKTANYAWYQVISGTGQIGTYCIYNNASLLKGFQNIGGRRYYLDAVTGQLQKEWFKSGTTDCYSDPHTGMITAGFREIDSQIYYLNSNGTPLKGWQRLLNTDKQQYEHYYFDAQGRKLTGWQTVAGVRYYFSEPASGSAAADPGYLTAGGRVSGNLTVGGEEYYFNTGGVMQTGWHRIYNNTGKVYEWKYFGSNGKRIAPTEEGNVTPGGEENTSYRWYLVEESEDGADSLESRYCVYNNTTLLKGFYNIGTHRYYFDTKGVLQKGSFTVGTARYYSDPDSGVILRSGLMLTAYDGNRYYYDGNGKQFAGWLNYTNVQGVTRKYYFHPGSGQAAEGFIRIGSHSYYFNPSTSPDPFALQKNITVPISGRNPAGE